MKRKAVIAIKAPFRKFGFSIPTLEKGGKGGFSKIKEFPDEHQLQWLEAQMEFFHKAMPVKAKRIRVGWRKGEIR